MIGRLLGLVVAVLLVCTAGCGYRLQGRGAGLPGDVRNLHVEMMENGTYEPFLENPVTNALVERFSRNPQLEIVEDKNRADAILSGKIVGYGNGAVSYDRDDRIAERRSTIVLTAALRRAGDNSVVWKGTVRWEEEYNSGSDKVLQDARENAAIAHVSERLADELYSRVVDGF